MNNFNGSGFGFSIYKDGELVNFKLGLIRDDSSFAPSVYRLVFFKEGTDFYHASSLYSGGKTGFGINDYEYEAIFNTCNKKFEVITKDPIEAISLCEKLQKEYDENKRAEMIKREKRYKEEVYDVLIKEFDGRKVYVDDYCSSGMFVKFNAFIVSNFVSYSIEIGYDSKNLEEDTIYGQVKNFFGKKNIKNNVVNAVAKEYNIYPECEFAKSIKKSKVIADKMTDNFYDRLNTLRKQIED